MPPKKKTIEETGLWSGEEDFHIEKEVDPNFSPGAIGKKRRSWKNFTTALDYFNIFWPQSLWESIVFKTNEKASLFIEKKME